MAVATDSSLGTIKLGGDLDGSNDATNPELTPTGVTPDSYSGARVVVDKKGRILEAEDFNSGEILSLIPCAAAGVCGLVQPQPPFTIAGGVLDVPLADENTKGVVQVGSGFKITGCLLEVDVSPATETTLGYVKVPSGGYLDISGSPGGELTIPIATSSEQGVVKVPDSDNLSVDAEGNLTFTKSIATTTTIGEVIVPTSGNIDVDGSGNISVPIATYTTVGLIKPDITGSPQTFTIDGSGDLVFTGNVTILPATTSTLGYVDVPTSGNIDVDGSGNISVPIATPSSKGVIEVDDSGALNISSGIVTIDLGGTYPSGGLGLVKSADASHIVISSGDIDVGPDVAHKDEINIWAQSVKTNVGSLTETITTTPLTTGTFSNVLYVDHNLVFDGEIFVTCAFNHPNGHPIVRYSTDGVIWNNGTFQNAGSFDVFFPGAYLYSLQHNILADELVIMARKEAIPIGDATYYFYKCSTSGSPISSVAFNVVSTFSQSTYSFNMTPFNIVNSLTYVVLDFKAGINKARISSDGGVSWSGATNITFDIAPVLGYMFNDNFLSRGDVVIHKTDNNEIYASTDGLYWERQLTGIDRMFHLSSDGRFYVLDFSSGVYTSEDGFNWINYPVSLSSISSRPRVGVADNKIIGFNNKEIFYYRLSGSPLEPQEGRILCASNTQLGFNSGGETSAYGNNKFVVIEGYPPSGNTKFATITNVSDLDSILEKSLDIDLTDSNVFEHTLYGGNYTFNNASNQSTGKQAKVILNHEGFTSGMTFENNYKFYGSSDVSNEETTDIIDFYVKSSGNIMTKITKDYS